MKELNLALVAHTSSAVFQEPRDNTKERRALVFLMNNVNIPVND
jgi:hypothetical protein